ncbi:MAG: cell wall anchor protein, partial [Dactylosporangium sp.]|nr:cell wall anchor protein [Dactylosporangium sp.]
VLAFAGAAGALTGPGTPAAASDAHSAAARTAAIWVSGQLADGAMPGPYGPAPDWGVTIDALFALQATGADPAAAETVTAAVAEHVRSYNSWDDWGVPGIVVSGATAKLLVAAVSTQSDPTGFGGFDLRAETLALVAGGDAGDQHGRVRDQIPAEYGTDSSNTFGQSFAVLGLARSGGVPQEVVDFLLHQQCAAGGFRLSPDVAGVPSASCDADSGAILDPDSTAMAVQALLAAADTGAQGAAASAARGAAWLSATQAADGSFAGSGATAGIANTNSTGLAGQALAAAGDTTAANRAADSIATRQLTPTNAGAAAADAGAIAYNDEALAAATAGGIAETARDQWRRATVQALLGLAQVPLGRLGTTTPGSQSASPPASTSSGSPAGSPSSASPDPSASTAGSASPTAGASGSGASTVALAAGSSKASGGGPLVTTGAPIVLVASAGLVLVGAGTLLAAATRRRKTSTS